MASEAIDVARILGKLARSSARPQYAFMVLNLLAEAAGPTGRAGPFIEREGQTLPVRDWLSDALSPMTGRDRRRQRLVARVRAELAGTLPSDPEEADRIVDAEVQARVRTSSKTNVSRAVTELVRTGLLRRHYEGWAKNHVNRGAQRHAVYTLDGDTLAAFRRRSQLV